MEYKKLEKPAYNIHFIKTDKFKKIKVRINFKEETIKEKIVYRNMLSLILLEATKTYPTRRLIDIQCENLYNISVGAGTSQSGNYNILRFDTTFLNEKYTEEGMTEKSFQFFLDFIFNLDVENGQFNIQSFNNAKNILKEDIESFNDSPSRYAFSRLYENMCPNSVLKYHNTGYIEDLEKVTPKNLYDYYKDLIRNDLIDIFIVGDIVFDNMEKIIANNFKVSNLKKANLSHFINQENFKNEPVIVKDSKEIKQSILIIASKLKDLTSFERQYVLALYDSILGGSPDSNLFKEVREKNSLCYSISSSHSAIANIEYISAGIDKSNFEKAVSLIKDEVNKMASGKFTEKQLEQAKTNYLASIKEIVDSTNSIINIYEAHEYLDYDLLREKEKNIINVSREDIINVSKKIYLDTIYLLEGDRHEEENN